MEIKSERQNLRAKVRLIIKSRIRMATTILEKYQVARSMIVGTLPYHNAFRNWYDRKIKEHTL